MFDPWLNETTANREEPLGDDTVKASCTDVPSGSVSVPQRIGRYRVERVLGQGGFGLVYLAHDEQLQRPVAIKVPHRQLVARPEDAEAYLTEARTVASLDHPNIVPVYDVGSTDDVPLLRRLEVHRRQRPRHQAQAGPAVLSTRRRNWWRRWPRRCTTPTSKGWSIGTSSRATSCSTRAASRSWPTSGWPCGSRTSARGHATPGRPPT